MSKIVAYLSRVLLGSKVGFRSRTGLVSEGGI